MATYKASQVDGQAVVIPNVTAPLAYSPVFTITGGAMTGQAHQSCWSQDVYFMDLMISFTGGTTTGTITNFTAQLPLNPATGTPYTIGGPTGSRYMGGGVDGFALITNRFDGTVQGVQGDTSVTLSLDSGNSYAAAGASRSLRMTIRIPIAEFLSTGYQAYGAGVSATGPSLVPGGYETGTHLTNWSGPFASTAGNIRYVRLGKNVTLLLPEVRLSGNNTLISISNSINLPASLRPAIALVFPCFVTNNGVDQDACGQFNIASNGAMQIGRTLSNGNFTATATTVGFYAVSVSYVTA